MNRSYHYDYYTLEMPAPESVTDIRKLNFPFEISDNRTGKIVADTVTLPPLGVNFNALDTRLDITRVNLAPSTSMRALEYILVESSSV